MNQLDLNFVALAKEQYPEFFNDRKILEIGALDVNGNVREPFENCTFTGIDWAAGKGVDIVVPAKETDFKPESFDVLLSFNHLEHDPDWQDSLSHNLPFIKERGILFLRWATRRSSAHGPEFDPHGKQGYYPKDLHEIVEFLTDQGLAIVYTSQDHNPSIGVMANVIALKK